MNKILKRDGRLVTFNSSKILNAIKKASHGAKVEIDDDNLNILSNDVVAIVNKEFYDKDKTPTVEDVQDIVEKILTSHNEYDLVKEYILYREKRTKERLRQNALMKTYNDLTFGASKNINLKRENGNINGETAMGKMLRYGSEGAKQFAHIELLSDEVSKAHQRGDIHIHDLDFMSTGTLTCQTRDTRILIKDNIVAIDISIDYFDHFFTLTDNLEPEIYNPKDIFILGRTGWTKLNAVSRRMVRKNENVFYLKTKDGLGLKLTGNHRIPVERNGSEVLITVDDAVVGDYLYVLNNKGQHTYDKAEIISIENYDYNDYVYDVTTEEHWYIANGYLSHNCNQINLEKLFEHGFFTGNGTVRTPNDIKTYAALACIAIQSDQNEQHGGQSIPLYDYYLAPGVAKSFIKNFCNILEVRYDIDTNEIKDSLKKYLTENDYHILNNDGQVFAKKLVEGYSDVDFDYCWNKAYKKTDRDTYQSQEALVHNLNTMASRAGSQVPFSSINFGTDISEEGRMVSLNLLYAMEAGLGNGETAIFPICILKVKDGVNFNPGDPNYDIYMESLKCTAKRLFPTFVFLDAPHNIKYYKPGRPETEVVSMGCVDGHEIIRYRIGGMGYERVEKFEDAWRRVASIKQIQKHGISQYIDVSNIDVAIMDSYSGGFVKVLKFIKNPNQNNWKKITFANGKTLLATSDHPLPVIGKGRTYVKDIVVGDRIPMANWEDDDEINWSSVESIIDIVNNAYSYDVETESDRFDVSGICSHNCRTRVIGNFYDPDNETVVGRGNLSFTSINLPRLGIRAKGDINKFYKLLDEKLDLVKEQLLDRMKLQGSYKVKNFPFLMGQGLWMGSEKLNPEDTLEEVIKQGSLSIGFIGLAETLVALTGKHHGESEESQKLGLEIIKHMRDYTDKLGEEMKLNWSLLATPAESLSGRFVKLDRKRFGVIKGVTDKEWYTNSTHVPVEYNISAADKIRIEAPYHALCNAGHIAYIEVDGDPQKNIAALDRLVRYMKECGVGYGAINHPVDRDPICGFTGIIDDECPCCGRKEYEGISAEKLESMGLHSVEFVPDENGIIGDGVKFNRIRRVTGYLVGDYETRFCNSKKAEVEARTKHM